MTRQEMIRELTKVQNTEKYMKQDILTITEFMDDQEVYQHLQRYKKDQ